MRLFARRITTIERERRDRATEAFVRSFDQWSDQELLALVTPEAEDHEPLTGEERETRERWADLEPLMRDCLIGCHSAEEQQRQTDAVLTQLVAKLQPRINRVRSARRGAR